VTVPVFTISLGLQRMPEGQDEPVDMVAEINRLVHILNHHYRGWAIISCDSRLEYLL
jgi:hypothetical protein